MPSWPGTLPQKPVADGYRATPLASNRVEFQPRIGAPQPRQRSTKAIKAITCSFLFSLAQTKVFESFYKVDLLSGTLLYDWVDPQLDEVGRFLIQEFTAGAAQPNIWRYSFTILRVS